MVKAYFKKIAKNYHKKSLNNFDFPFLNYSDNEKVGIDSYKTNVIVHRCVSLIATSASHVPWQIFKNNHLGVRKIIKNHPGLDLLKHPNSETSGADFFIQSLSNLLLYGNNYIFISLQNNQPTNLCNVHPSLINVVTNNGKIVSYNVGIENKRQNININPASGIGQILHIKNYNPTDQNNGLSALSAASSSINLHAKIMDWNKSLLKNAIRPSGALVFQDGDGYLTDEQFERLQQQFYENFSGSSNSGKPLILEGGLKWQETSNAEKFEKFIELKDSSARDIAIAFNVPPQLMANRLNVFFHS